MKNFDFNRFKKVVVRDFHSAYNLYGLSLLIIMLVPAMLWMLEVAIGMGEGDSSPFVRMRLINFLVYLAAIIAPLKIYGSCNLQGKGNYFAMLPASLGEKFWSMLLYSFVVSPLAVFVGSCAVDTLLTILPVLLLCPLTPQEVGLVPFGADESSKGDEQTAATQDGLGLSFRMLTPTFAALITFVLSIVLITSLAGHMASLAQDYGYSAQIGALLLSASMVGNVFSKFTLGAIADRFGVFKAIICSLTTTICGLVLILLNLGGQGALLASGFLFGTSFSIGSLGISLLTRHLYGDAQYSSAYSTISLITSFASALGVTVAGFLFDITGSYAAPIASGIVLAILAGACLAYLHWRVTTRPWEKRAAQ